MVRTRKRRAVAGASAAVLAAAVAAQVCAGNSAAAAAPAVGFRNVLLVGNSASHTVSFIDAATDKNLGSIDIAPDAAQVIAGMDLIASIGYQVVMSQEGGIRDVDDIALSPDGTTLYVSRGNLDDAVAFDLTKLKNGIAPQKWLYKTPGFHADHAALSPDGKMFVVSATTDSTVQAIDTATGKKVGSFPTGTYPHQNDFSADGTKIYNSSIGQIALPYALDWAKGPRQLTVADAKTFKVLRQYNFKEGIRPSVVTPDGKTMWAELSYLNGFIKYDLTTGTITKTVTEPFGGTAATLPKDSYAKNSAFHGLALSADQSRLCLAGTIDDYTMVVNTSSYATTGRIDYPAGSIPYWSTTGTDGTTCFVSLSGANAVSVIDMVTGKETARVPVGSYPQRSRMGEVAASVLANLAPAAG